MPHATKRMAAWLVIATMVISMAGCVDTAQNQDTASPGTAPAGEMSLDCSVYESFGDLKGKTVSIYTSIVAPEDESYIDSFKPFEDCTDVTVKYEGSKEFEKQLVVRVKGDTAPDLAVIPQPGLLQTVVKDTGRVVAPPEQVATNVDQHWDEAWKGYGSVGGTFYAAPLGASVKSFVWYSPKTFTEKGYQVPKTWDELMKLTAQIAKDDAKAKPWCAGFGAGDATGWPGTDWLEDMVLRSAGPEVFDHWVKHEIAFNDPKIVAALDQAGQVLKNDAYVNGGFGDVKSIASTTFQDAGQPILQKTCYLHRQASFYAANWPEGTQIGPEGDVYAFYLPAKSAEGAQPVLGAGDFVAAFSDRPEVKALQTYLSTPEWPTTRPSPLLLAAG